MNANWAGGKPAHALNMCWRSLQFANLHGLAVANLHTNGRAAGRGGGVDGRVGASDAGAVSAIVSDVAAIAQRFNLA